MKKRLTKLIYLFIAIFTLMFSSCFEGESYCPDPNSISEFNPNKTFYDTTNAYLEVELLGEFTFDKGQDKTLYSFSIPPIFINPKGKKFKWDVVKIPKYRYTLKSTKNLPDSVKIEGLTFNDCSESDAVSTYIKFVSR